MRYIPIPLSLRWLLLLASLAAVLCLLALLGPDRPLALWVQQHLRSWQPPFAQLTAWVDWVQGNLFYGYRLLLWPLLFVIGRFGLADLHEYGRVNGRAGVLGRESAVYVLARGSQGRGCAISICQASDINGA